VSGSPPIRVAVVGAGSFGRNHLRVYRQLESEGKVVLSAAVESNSAAAALVATEYSIPVFASVAELISASLGITAASVCVPTMHHARVGCELLSAGIDVLVEKPIASSLEDADALIQIADTNSRILQIGHLERFNPAVTAVLPHVRQPMFFEVHRLSVFTPRSLDIDVVLDLMIHDLDVVLSLVRSPLREVRAVGLPVLSHKTDIANVRLAFANGCIANLTASRISTERVRKMRFFQPRQYFSIDFAHQEALFIDVSAANLSPGQLAALSASHDGPHPSPGLALSKLPIELKEPLTLEIESFLECVRTRGIPRVTGQDGRNALALAFEIERAILDHVTQTGLERFISSI